MINTESLREKILSFAMRGELSIRDNQDGLASDLYASIIEEKEKLVKEGKIRKDKKYDDIDYRTVPYEIPENWEWVRFGKIINLQSGQDLGSTEYNSDSKGIPYITGASNYSDAGEILINRWTESPKAFAYKNDILLSCKGTVGKLAILHENEVHIARQIMGIRTFCVDVAFMFYYVQSMIYGIKESQKGLIPGIERNDVLDLICPLPPIAEQERIVSRIEELFTEIDKIDELQAQYASDIEVLKSKLIDAGIQGKLTEQLPEDGTAEDLRREAIKFKEDIEKKGLLKNRKNKDVKEVNASDNLYDLPESWRWFRLGEIAEVFGRIGFRGYKKTDLVQKGQGAITMSPSNISKGGDINFDDSTYISWEKYEESPEIMLEEGDVVLVKTGSTYGKSGIIESLPEKATINPQLAILKYIQCNRKYLAYVLRSSAAWTQYESFVVGAATPTFSQEKLSNMLLPMPPMAEQERIVDKLDRIIASM